MKYKVILPMFFIALLLSVATTMKYKSSSEELYKQNIHLKCTVEDYYRVINHIDSIEHVNLDLRHKLDLVNDECNRMRKNKQLQNALNKKQE